MYGKIHERKIKQQDYVLSCQQTRKQLEEYIDAENRRVNIDSAKKLAVIQHMDYEGFRQMVLGANIFPTKSKQLYVFTKGQDISNNSAIANKFYEDKKNKQQTAKHEYQIQRNSQRYCNNFIDFKKKFMKNYSKQLTWEQAEQCYWIIKQQNKNRLEKIFNAQCEADIILKIIEVFIFILNYLQKQQKLQQMKQQYRFIIKFLQTILTFSTMQDISLTILTKKQKSKIYQFILNAKNIFIHQQQLAWIQKVSNLIKS